MDFKLVILAVAPAITLVLFIYFFDKHDKEPISLLLKVFLFGAPSCGTNCLCRRFINDI